MPKERRRNRGQIRMIVGGLMLLLGESMMNLPFYDSALAFVFASTFSGPDFPVRSYAEIRFIYKTLFYSYPIITSIVVGLHVLGASILAWGMWAYHKTASEEAGP